MLGRLSSLASDNALLPLFHYLDRVLTYLTFTFGGVEGSHVEIVVSAQMDGH